MRAEWNSFDEFNRYKNIFSGLRTIPDCYYILSKLEVDTKTREIILSIIEEKKRNTDKNLDMKTMIEIVNELDSYKYREDVYAQIPHFMTKTNNLAQIRTFTRIANSKPLRPEYMSMSKLKYKYHNLVTKKCPHCNHECKAAKFTEYVICGYQHNGGYDWEGCGKDWCFKCGKILCKSWDSNMLFIEENRVHNGICCARHAEINEKKYPDDYCQCKNLFVNRSIMTE